MIASPQIPAQARPGLLRRVNRERVVRSLQTRGPLSRSDVAKHTGLGYATAVKICDSLEASGFAESCEGLQQDGAGRPGNYLRMSVDNSQVIALTIGPMYVRVAIVGLDGSIIEQVKPQSTAKDYQSLIKQVVQLIENIRSQSQANTLGLGLSIPGLIDGVNGTVILAPNLPIIDKQDIRSDLENQTGLKTKLSGMMEAQFLVEQIRGRAANHENFALINYLGGLGVAAACDGRRISGSRSMAGEIGHVVVDPKGESCGCGNRGCLETLATDTSLAARVSKKLKRKVSVEDVLEIHQQSPELIADEVDHFLDYLAIAIGFVMQAYNPSAVFLLGRFLENNDESFAQLKNKLPHFCLEPLLENCEIHRSLSYPVNGAGLAIIEDLISELPTKS